MVSSELLQVAAIIHITTKHNATDATPTLENVLQAKASE